MTDNWEEMQRQLEAAEVGTYLTVGDDNSMLCMKTGFDEWRSVRMKGAYFTYYRDRHLAQGLFDFPNWSLS